PSSLETRISTSAIYATTTIASFILRFKNRRAPCSFAVYSVIPLSRHGPTGWERSSACLAPEFHSGGDINRKKITWNGNDCDPRRNATESTKGSRTSPHLESEEPHSRALPPSIVPAFVPDLDALDRSVPAREIDVASRPARANPLSNLHLFAGAVGIMNNDVTEFYRDKINFKLKRAKPSF